MKKHHLSLHVRMSSIPRSEAAAMLTNTNDLVVWWLQAETHTHMMTQCLVSSGSDMYLHFSGENLHFSCHMPRLTSVHVDIFSILKFSERRTERHACAIHWDTQLNEEDAEQIFPQVDKSWHRHRCIWQIPRFCACLNVSQMVVNSEAWRDASLCEEAIGEEH